MIMSKIAHKTLLHTIALVLFLSTACSSPAPTASPSALPEPTATPVPAPTLTDTATPTPSPSPTAIATLEPTAIPHKETLPPSDPNVIWAGGTDLLIPAGQLWGHDGSGVYSVAWSPDGATIASGTEDGTIVLWDALSGEQLSALSAPDVVSVRDVAWSFDGVYLATANHDASAIVWDAASGEQLQRLLGHDGLVFRVAWSPDGTSLATGSWDGSIALWDVQTGARARVLGEQHQDPSVSHWSITDLSWSPDGERIAASSFGSEVVVWNLSTGEVEHTLSGHSDTVLAVAWSAHGQTLWSGSDDGNLIEWNAATGARLQTLHADSKHIYQVELSPDDTLVAAACDKGHDVVIWEVASGERLNRLSAHSSYVFSIGWSPDQMSLASASGDASVIVWRIAPTFCSVTASGEALTLRQGPGTDYDENGALEVGRAVPVVGQSEDGLWWRVVVDGARPWVVKQDTSLHEDGVCFEENIPLVTVGE